jgi:hypothetical protein
MYFWQAGIINAAGRDLHPWDKSHSFRKELRSKKGSNATFPSGGKSLSVFAPSKHRLFIKYCSYVPSVN